MKQFGLRKKECLLRPYQYKAVYQSRRLTKSTIVWLYTMPNGLEYNRLGISASKKICLNNVTRNRVKRLLKQVYQLNKSIFGKGEDIVFVIKKLPEKLDFKTLETIVKKMVEKNENNIDFKH